MREGVWGAGSQRPAAGGEESGEGDGTNLEALTMRSCEKNKGGALTGFFRWKKVRGTAVVRKFECVASTPLSLAAVWSHLRWFAVTFLL